MDFNLIGKKFNVPNEIVLKAFENAIEVILCKDLNVKTVIVDVDDRTAQVIFQLPFDMDLREALVFNDAIIQADPLHVVFDLKAFPAHLVNRIGNYFTQNLYELKDYYDYGVWRPKIHRIIDGVILENYDDYLEIEIDGQTAVMERSKWNHSEVDQYRPGQLKYFFIDGVAKNPFQISLSRSNLKLPALLLKHYLPWHSFLCKKRYVGQKSFIFTDAPIDNNFSEIRENVSTELNGEILEVRPFRPK